MLVGMEALRTASLIATLLTTGLMAGVYVAFSIAVLPGLARTSDSTFVEAMRAMNIAILNGWFAVVFGGPLVFGLVAVGTRVTAGERTELGWTVLGVALYVLTLGVTAAVNVPLNNRLQDSALVEEARSAFERRWVRWNGVRSVLCVTAFAALTAAVAG